MKKVLIATTNPQKINYYSSALNDLNVEVLGLKDIEITIDIDENGETPKENAIIKAKLYYKESGMIIITDDVGLFIEGLPKEKQPGTHVRRINGRRAADDEAIEYYVEIIKSLGGKANGQWIKSVAIAISANEVYTHDFIVNKIFTSNISNKRNEGYPLDSITITPEFNKYTSELTEEENIQLQNSRDRDVMDFIKSKLQSSIS